LENLAIALPPLPEQRRIAGILREQLAAVERARASLVEQTAAISALPGALLRRAFAGGL
jgi:type I restriction enzyme S subunit